MNRDELIELACRVEKLEGRNMAVGRECYRAAGWRQSERGYFLGPLTTWTSPDGKISFDDDDFRRHDPTASLDNAMTLLPDGWWIGCMYFNHPIFRSKDDKEWCAEISGPVIWVEDDGFPEPTFDSKCAGGSTPALALTAASLRAIAERVG